MNPRETTSWKRVVFDSFDPEAMEQTLQESTLEHTLLARGDFTGQLVQAATADTRIDVGGYDLPVLATGPLTCDRISLGFLIRAAQPCVFNAEIVNQGDLILYGEEQELHVNLSAGSRWVAVQMDRSLCACVGIDLPSSLPHALRQEPRRAAQLRALIASSVNLIAGAGTRNESTSAESARAIEGFRDAMLSAVGRIMADRHARVGGSPPGRSLTQMRLVGQAEEFVEAHLGEPITVSDICKTIVCQIHTLERAFNHVLGVTPRRFIAQRRLARLRRLLLAGSVGELSITDAMLSCGFYHPGRAATVYRSCFGEAPSATLKRLR
jgi:AraC-like DNA-binding protein